MRYALCKADSGGAATSAASQRRVSKQAMMRRQSTALNIANTLDALKEQKVRYSANVVMTFFQTSSESLLHSQFLRIWLAHISQCPHQSDIVYRSRISTFFSSRESFFITKRQNGVSMNNYSKRDTSLKSLDHQIHSIW